MAQADREQTAMESAPQIEMESGAYEIIRNRLVGHGKELRKRLDQLNEARKEVFGSIDATLLGTERITTQHNCVPRDMISIGNRFLFGYNIHFGLKTETNLADVFAVYEFSEQSFRALPLDMIANERFEKDFQDVYRYYKKVVFAKFFVSGPNLHMVFRVGKQTSDIKTFKWLVQGDQLTYVDNRSDHEVRFPPPHDFEWIRTHRDLHRAGDHPHISIEDRVFVETIGGDLTIKIEDNTDTGHGVYSEPVANPDQTLDDAEIFYAILGNIILLKIRPYQELNYRYFVYNEKIERAIRLDAIETACVLLPDDHGLIFPNGYYLQTGEFKTFSHDLTGMLYERRVASPNGEDYLYIFYNRDSGVYILLEYNLIEQSISTPNICNGSTFFQAGEFICFKARQEPQKHHAVQIWRTPYVGEDYVPTTNTDSFLYKIGNREIVRSMAECHEVLALIEKEDTYANLYIDLVRESADIIDSYFWISKPETFNAAEVLSQIRNAAASAVDEFDKVVRVKQETAATTHRVEDKAEEIIQAIQRKRFDQIGDFVASLSEMRKVRGEIVSLRELRYVDLEMTETLEAEVAENSDRLARRCVEFLLRPDSLSLYEQQIEVERDRIGDLTKVTDAKQVEEKIGASAGELEMLIEIVSNLEIDDATHRTTIIDNISAIFSKVNQARAALKTKTRELLSVEGIAEFNSQLKLLNQSVVNYLDICESPEKCEEFLTKMMIQIEELDGRFAEFDEFVAQLTEKREEIYNAFETRKLVLVETRNKRAGSLMGAAERILKGIKSRVDSLESIDDINAYFASDLMIEKVRDIVKQLGELDDSVKVDDIQSRMKTVREDAVRQLKDRQDLFVDGKNIIKFGKHHFSVNVQALDVTTVLRDGEMSLHLTGTNFFEPIDDPAFLATRDVWDQEVVSENRDVYRGEYLAYCMLRHLQRGEESTIEDFLRSDQAERIGQLQRFMGPRFNEAYSKGVHDHDAEKILSPLLEMHTTIGLLRYSSRSRAMATAFWQHFGDKQQKSLVEAKLTGFGVIQRLFPDVSKQTQYIHEICAMLAGFVEQHALFSESLLDEAAEYLFHELTAGGDFRVSRSAAELFESFHDQSQRDDWSKSFQDSLKSVKRDAASATLLARDWIQAFLDTREDREDKAAYVDEAAVWLLRGKIDHSQIIDGQVTRDIAGVVGSHRVITSGAYRLHYNLFVQKLRDFEREVVPRYRDYITLKSELVEKAREDLRLDEFRPRVLTSFVRNQLIDTVYLPIIGDNLAKQIGVVGEGKRTDLMGLLLLVSPPGYGKTTLMEYIANRLGIIFMKINGPVIGHAVTSLDPSEAPNAAAREEVAKLNLSLEMGDNVMIYLDDIQHCNPEFLQKFISLCDAQRKIEGVYKGRTRTYDLRGRKVCVVMAGNPYTESGEKFQIPDMLANRADIYNLGEIIGETADVFEMSYLENSLTSNPVLNRLAAQSQNDVYAIYKMAQRGEREGMELEGNYSLEELNEFVTTMKKLMRVRDVILSVNREYIRSAAQADEYRTEPSFKLQGSYRNMNRIAEKVVPIMNDRELDALIMTNYENDAQTLTSNNEANMLKFKELIGTQTEQEASRWEDIKRAYSQNIKMKGIDTSDKVGQVIVQLSSFNDGLHAIRKALSEGISHLASDEETTAQQQSQAASLIERLGAMEVGLEKIGGSLSGGLEKLLEHNRQFLPDQDDDLKQIHAADALITLADELRNLTTGTIPLDPKQRTHHVSVMHKVPRSILDVVKSQFDVMNKWLEPLLTATHTHTAEIQELKESLGLALQNYDSLLKELVESEANLRREGKK